jgi:hypothetical protein
MSNTLHNVYGIVDADENVLERYRYDAYGAYLRSTQAQITWPMIGSGVSRRSMTSGG